MTLALTPIAKFSESTMTPDAAKLLCTNGEISLKRALAKLTRLTHEEEILLARQVQRYQSILIERAEHLESTGRPLADETLVANGHAKSVRQLQAIIAEGKAAITRYEHTNLKLVRYVANQYDWKGFEFLDRFQEGYFGLRAAVVRFDPTYGARFATYAHWHIRAAIRNAWAEQCRNIKVPRHVQDAFRKARKVQALLSQTLERQATLEEVADAMELSKEKLRQLVIWCTTERSLNHPTLEGNDELLNMVSDNDMLELEAIETPASAAEQVAGLLAKLKPVQANVLRLKFGLVSGTPLSTADTAEELGIKPERVRTAQKTALNKLKFLGTRSRLFQHLRSV